MSITVPHSRDETYSAPQEHDDIDPISACIPSPRKPSRLDCQPQNHASICSQKKESFHDKVSQSTAILELIRPDKRRFFRPLAEAITASGADQLGKILILFCDEYPDARAVVESLLADTSDDIVDVSR